jgi:predicted thioesterase
MRTRSNACCTRSRRYLFEVEAWDEVEKIAEVRHERFMVSDLARFLEDAATKADRAKGSGRAS